MPRWPFSARSGWLSPRVIYPFRLILVPEVIKLTQKIKENRQKCRRNLKQVNGKMTMEHKNAIYLVRNSGKRLHQETFSSFMSFEKDKNR